MMLGGTLGKFISFVTVIVSGGHAENLKQAPRGVFAEGFDDPVANEEWLLTNTSPKLGASQSTYDHYLQELSDVVLEVEKKAAEKERQDENKNQGENKNDVA